MLRSPGDVGASVGDSGGGTSDMGPIGDVTPSSRFQPNGCEPAASGVGGGGLDGGCHPIFG